MEIPADSDESASEDEESDDEKETANKNPYPKKQLNTSN
jgi:hypothetical protein